MNRNKKAAPYLLLTALTLFFVSFFVLRYGVFGSKVDWLSQHSVLPDYFRQQFYDTGSLFPEFAANIGGGQNIYNFSYYGLYSPVVMFSYLLPWVKMSDYLMAASILNLTASGLLFYRWLIRRGISTATAMWTAFYFLLAAPMIFHSYGHLMFVNYMPFLCMALMGVDVYPEEHRTGLYIFGVFLMIMSSFYFSIGGMLVLMLYGVHRYIQIRERAGNGWGGIGFFKDGVRFLFPMLTAVLLSGILLVPTAFALAGRKETETAVSMGSLLLPQVPILRFVYHPYGIGLTTLVMTVLLTGFTYRKWSDRLLSIGCAVVLTVPVFAYLLNGGLYIRDKVMIPFLPLLCYLTADYIEKQRKHEISFAAGFTPYLFTLLLLFVGRSQSECRPYWKFIFPGRNCDDHHFSDHISETV